jgi:hypothetical protein
MYLDINNSLNEESRWNNLPVIKACSKKHLPEKHANRLPCLSQTSTLSFIVDQLVTAMIRERDCTAITVHDADIAHEENQTNVERSSPNHTLNPSF